MKLGYVLLAVALAVTVWVFISWYGTPVAEAPENFSPVPTPTYLEYENPDDIIIPDGKGGIY